MNKILKVLTNLKTMSPANQLSVIKSLKNTSHTPAEIKQIEQAINEEASPWLRTALNDILPKPDVEALIETNIDEGDLSGGIDVDAIKSEATSESIGQILHELNPIIGTINLYAGLEVPNFEDSELKGELDRLEETIETFQDWQRVEQSPRFKLVNALEVIQKEVKRYNHENIYKITVNISKELTLDTDSSLLRIIISNSIRNAIEATSLGAEKNKKPIVINGGLTDKVLWVSVVDNGKGLGQKQQVLLKSNYTTKTGHNGLGLAIVNKAVGALNGNWDLKNGDTQGAVFYCEIPIRKKQ
jgi:signal transduction histidine kinase